MFKVAFSVLAVFVVTTSVCSAADLDSSDYYSLAPIQSLSPIVNSALDYAVQPLAATSWDTSDQSNLQNIRDALVGTPSYAHSSSIYSNVDSIQDWIAKIGSATVSSSTASTLLSNLEDINTWLNSSGISDSLSDLESGLVGTTASVLWYAREIYNDTSELHNIYLSTSNTSRMSEEIYNALEGDYDSVKSVLKSIWGDTEDISSSSQSIYSYLIESIGWKYGYSPNNQFAWVGTTSPLDINSSLSFLVANFGYNGEIQPLLGGPGLRTFYNLVYRLQQVLASDDDLVLANSQKANREEIKNTFLTGSSGSTSLGVSDFGDLADVGGTIKDSLSLDGNATIGSFTSGLAAADSAGQGWFSEETRSQLDAVSSTVTYSLRDSDPYNMAGWEDRYYWLLGDDE